MRAFEVYVNGKRLHTAGVGPDGILTTSVSWGGLDRDGQDLFWMHVQGQGPDNISHV